MAERKIPRAEEIFSGRSGGKYDASSKLFKKKKAPTPPSGLPKIGSYQPKSLAALTPAGPMPGHAGELQASEIVNASHMDDSRHKQFIVGDKDTPLEIAAIEHEQPVAPPRRKRKAPPFPGIENGESYQLSDNPIFGQSVSNASLDIDTDIGYGDRGGSIDVSNISVNGSIEPDYDEQGGDIDFGIEIDDEPTSAQNSKNRSVQRLVKADVHQNGEANYPFIPPPDYDAEEYTFNFEEEEGTHVYKEYAGEDFGKYLEDDEDYRNVGRRVRKHGGGAHLHRGPKAFQQPSVQGKKYKKKRKQPEAANRNTIRDFTFNDTKIGWGDRTVKSTSAKGRYIKREKERNRVDPREHFSRAPSQGVGSYEEFLMGNKGQLDSPNSSDSGVDTGEDRLKTSGVRGEINKAYIADGMYERPASDIFYHSQPKQIRNGTDTHGQKASFWKRLTWRFKKTVNITTMDER